MKRTLEYLIAVVLIGAAILAGAHALGGKSHSDNKAAAPAAKPKTAAQQPAACTIFSLQDAKQLLGDTAKGGPNTTYDSAQGDLKVSTCTYIQDTGSNSPISSANSATLLVRAPKSQDGSVTNNNQFGRLKPTDVQDISGYGDSAYWDGQHGQMDILKNNTWYILSYGPAAPASRSLDQTKQLANMLINKL